MRLRMLATALVALIGLTAFAPAPFVRPDRKRDRDGADLLASLQGTWSISSKVRMNPNGNLSKYSTSQKLRIENDTWQFVSALEGKGKAKGKVGRVAYRLNLDPTGYPRKFRVQRTTGTKTDYMVGILAVEGEIKMLYRLASSTPNDTNQPRNFADVPVGWYLMTLKRDK
jgi:hypothetical protein